MMTEITYLDAKKVEQLPSCYYVYAIFCQDPDTKAGYVKFGYSKRVLQRFAELRTGCPLPIGYYAIRRVGSNRHSAWLCEQRLHRRFEARKSRGEWFKFDFYSEEDKADFNQGCREQMGANPETGNTWEKFSSKHLDKFIKQQKNGFLNSKKNREMFKKFGHSADTKAAWRELRNYGT